MLRRLHHVVRWKKSLRSGSVQAVVGGGCFFEDLFKDRVDRGERETSVSSFDHERGWVAC